MTKYRASLPDLASALRTRKLDHTLTTAVSRTPEVSTCASGVRALDDLLQGGVPRGQVSTIAGPPSSGRTTLLLQLLAVATRRGEWVALIDPFDRGDLESFTEARIDGTRLLWVRGQRLAGSTVRPGEWLERLVTRAVKALHLVLQAGWFGLVALDVADMPDVSLSRVPFTTWLRIHRAVEGTETACVMLAPSPAGRSAGGVTLLLSGQPRWEGHAGYGQRLAGLDVCLSPRSPRRSMTGSVQVSAVADEVGVPTATSA